MKLIVETNGVTIDPWVEDFVRTTLVFAVWHHDVEWTGALVRLEREPAGDAVRCDVQVATRERGVERAGAVGGNVCEALQEAADRLEVRLYRGPTPDPGERAAA